ncbi:3817_t:CDS:2 [Paraglomus brasilianum]|uniref:3817_t:CDS:1 n=1 Tax=Paraglomus brasilianum TaxID=144538 RepID=A0A9N8ZDJ2_9GLOM|nr:3817_t:CDS:2 [Paraglomus brasilianum]
MNASGRGTVTLRCLRRFALFPRYSSTSRSSPSQPILLSNPASPKYPELAREPKVIATYPLSSLNTIDPYLDWEGQVFDKPFPAYKPPDVSLSENETEMLSTISSLTPNEIQSMKRKALVVKRVVNQTGRGKIPSILLKYFERYDDRTVYHDIEYKFGGTRLRLFARPPGFGIRTNHYIHEVCSCLGYSDIAGKVLGSRNPMNVIKATFEAFLSQRLPRDIATQRGKRLMDVHHVYYGAD